MTAPGRAPSPPPPAAPINLGGGAEALTRRAAAAAAVITARGAGPACSPPLRTRAAGEAGASLAAIRAAVEAAADAGLSGRAGTRSSGGPSLLQDPRPRPALSPGPQKPGSVPEALSVPGTDPAPASEFERQPGPPPPPAESSGRPLPTDPGAPELELSPSLASPPGNSRTGLSLSHAPQWRPQHCSPERCHPRNALPGPEPRPEHSARHTRGACWWLRAWGAGRTPETSRERQPPQYLSEKDGATAGAAPSRC